MMVKRKPGDPLLPASEAAARLTSLNGWTKKGKEIRKVFEFPDFVRAMAFVNAVALLAQRANHHPDIDIRWNRVTLVLSTHSAGGLTTKDFDLADRIEEL
ncbi:MAG TPA: 4a-hydroxytetrahydrobiopterin dehydratase [Bacteroidota bacterium]|nr:4a-hydroxytetrahydrobiopterin dehydratase [Bacteroidota bacterium]